MFGEICEGVAAAHAQGVVHRDLKPANILLDGASPGGGGRSAIARVADFGLGKVRAEHALAASRATSLLAGAGTAGYMSREQKRGEPADPADDVYALGVILFQLLTGQVQPDVSAHVMDELRDLAEPPPENWITLVGDCLRTRAQRAASARELLDRIELWKPKPAPSSRGSARLIFPPSPRI